MESLISSCALDGFSVSVSLLRLAHDFLISTTEPLSVWHGIMTYFFDGIQNGNESTENREESQQKPDSADKSIKWRSSAIPPPKRTTRPRELVGSGSSPRGEERGGSQMEPDDMDTVRA